MSLSFDPFAPWWVLGLFILVGVAAASLSLWRNWRSGLLRSLAIASLIGLLINPQWRNAEETPLDDIVLVLSDLSASQLLDARDTATTSVISQLTERLDTLENIEIRFHEFSGEEETRTVGALRTALADTPRSRLGGVFIVTDGQSADAEDAGAELRLNAPVHLLITGKHDEIDRKITLTNAPRYGIVRQSVRVSFRIDDLGIDEIPIDASGSAIVVLRIDGVEILRQTVPFGEEVGFDAPLSRPGRSIIELQVETRVGELTERNNTVILPITAIRDRLRVLLISGEPHPGERVWRNLLKSDPAVDLVHFTILRPIDKYESAPISELSLIPFPQDELFIDKLSEFDLLIFDRYTYRGVLSAYHFDNIARFVDQGGAVLIASGPEYNGSLSLAARRNLSFILPAIPNGAAIEQPFRPAVTELGNRHPVTANLPEQAFWGRWLRLMPVLKLRGQTLMTGPDATPLLILDRVGEGRIGLFLSDHVWLWARGFDGGGPHAELLRRIAHWLMKEPELEEEALSLRGDGNTLIIERRTMSDTPSSVTLTHPDGEKSDHDLAEVEPGKYAALLKNMPRGLYRAVSDDLFAIGEIGLAAAPEFIDVVSHGGKLAPLATNTGGGVFRVQRDSAATLPIIRRLPSNIAARSGDDWAGILERGDRRIESVKESPAAPPLIWLMLIGAALFAAWRIEGGKRRKT